MKILNARIDVQNDVRNSTTLARTKRSDFDITLRTEDGTEVKASGSISAVHEWGIQSHDMYEEDHLLSDPHLCDITFAYSGEIKDRERVRAAIESAFIPARTGTRLVLEFTKGAEDHLFQDDHEAVVSVAPTLESTTNVVGNATTTDEYRNSVVQLLDGLAEMIESGRLTQASIPDDFQWLQAAMSKLKVTQRELGVDQAVIQSVNVGNNAQYRSVEVLPGATKMEILEVRMIDLIDDYTIPDEMPEWRWIEEQASFSHRGNGTEEGVWEFVINLSSHLDNVPDTLLSVIKYAQQEQCAYIVFHQ